MSDNNNNKEEQIDDTAVSDDARIQIKAKDAAEQLLPGGKSVSEMSGEDLTTYTSNMVKADRLYAKHTESLPDSDREVFDALLLASDQNLGVEERFESALGKFNAVKNPKEESPKETPKETDSPQGNMDAGTRTSASPLNNQLETANDAPLGDDDDYFKYLQDRFRQQTTMKRGLNVKT